MNPAIIVILATVLGGIILFFILHAFKLRSRRKSERNIGAQEKLEAHFSTINLKAVKRIIEMANNLKVNGHGEMVFGNGAPVSARYPFEKEVNYESFVVHFAEFAIEWEKLKRKALMFKESQSENVASGISVNLSDNSLKPEICSLLDIEEECRNFAIRLSKEADYINEYGIGNPFKQNEKCPICKDY
ncbi:hypothetical protein ACFLXP_00320 [Chloroflexota bacterium]